MRPRTDGTRAVLACACALLACSFQNPSGKPEELARLDPYTRGEAKALERAGYVSFGPFPFLAETDTADIEKTLGQERILWVETAHFRIGSTLAAYTLGVDKLEDRRLRDELERLSKKLAHFEPAKNKLDPWLRLHLFAQRLEEQYAEFLARFGFEEREFALPREFAPSGGPALGPGEYLGMELKPTVLLTESNAALGRFVGRFTTEQEACNWRGPLRGGTMFLGQSAECLRLEGFELDTQLYCAVAADLAYNFVDGFRGYHDSSPEWFKCGLASWFSRRIDERWTIYARGTTVRTGDDSWKWERRVRGLVENGLAPSWPAMLEWRRWEDIDAPGHMAAWSRVDWLLAHKQAGMRALLLAETEPLIVPRLEQQSLQTALGASLAELDAQWKDFVLKSAPRK